MARLYLANCSKQHHDFAYRVPAEDMRTFSQVKVQRIEAGTQMLIYREAPLPVLEAIVEQHRLYGLAYVRDVVNAKDFVGLCYSFDEPVSFDKLQYVFDKNSGALFERGKEQREQVAVAVANELEGIMSEAARRPIRAEAVTVDVVEEDDNPSGAVIKVTRDEQVAAQGGRSEGRWR